MYTIVRWLLFVVLITVNSYVYGQYLSVHNGDNITHMPGDEVNADWSSDSKNLIFENVHNGKSSILLYMLNEDTLINLSNPDQCYRNPTWHPDGNKIVFDSNKDESDYLYSLDLNTMKVVPLFNRNIACRNASFSASARQVYFTGYDELNDRWEIYSYDFIYDNINCLTNHKLGCDDSDISFDGKQIAYCKSNPFNQTKNIMLMNWYGEHIIGFNEFTGEYPTWGSSNLKLFFVSNMDNKNVELYSIWKDGSHLERLTNDEIEIAYPIVSPDGSKIAMSVLTESGWDIYIVPFDNY